MKHGNPCPKCGSSNQISQLQQANVAGENSIFAGIPFTRCACLDCGYFEDWYLPERLKPISDRLDRQCGAPWAP